MPVVTFGQSETIVLPRWQVPANAQTHHSSNDNDPARALPSYERLPCQIPIWSRSFRDYPRNFRPGTVRSTMPLKLRISRGNSRMGERVTQSGRSDLARASRLKKALHSSHLKRLLLPRMARAPNIPVLCRRSRQPRQASQRPIRTDCSFWSRCFRHRPMD